MENVATAGMAVGAQVSSTAAPTVTGQQLPLTFLKEGEKATVVQVRGNAEMSKHLADLGFVPGAEVSVVSGIQGDLIVSVKGAQVAIGKGAANHIITSA